MARSPNTPLFKQIEQTVAEEIIRGVFPLGHRLPSETELMERFSASRQTVSKAITELAKLGLVERNRRAGTTVSRQFQERYVLPLYDISTEMRRRGRTYEFDVVTRERIRNNSGGRFWNELPEGADLLYLETLHEADGAPTQFERRFVNLAAAPRAADEPFTEVTPASWLLERAPWTQVRHRISAISADADLAEKLQLATGAACVLLERRTYNLQAPITVSYQTLAGDRFPIEGEHTLGALADVANDDEPPEGEPEELE